MAESVGPDFSAIKVRQQGAWAAGNYAVIGSSLQMPAELLCEAMDVRGGWRVLDVAAGNGAATLAAARRWCEVTSTDFVPALLEQGRARAAAEGWAVTFAEADAENLPFADGVFDAALSTFGIMFTPNQERSAAEIFRVVRAGGKIGFVNWTPASFVGEMFKVIGKYAPPPAGLKPPSTWGTEARLKELFPEAARMEMVKRFAVFRYVSAEHWFEIFRTYYGPMNRTYNALDETGKAGLWADILALLQSMNTATDGTLVLPSEYLEVVITK